MNIPTILLKDGYKVGHIKQYPKGTEYVYSNYTPRTSRVKDVDYVIFFGLQYFIQKYLIEDFNKNFFNQPKDKVLVQYKRRIENYLGKDAITYDHIAELYDLGYLPIKIKSLPEGTKVPCNVPVLTIINTNPKFFWLTNMLETLMSNILWLPSTSATTAFRYRKEFEQYAKITGAPKEFIKWQGHDFSMRGMADLEASMKSGAAHLLSFTGTDTISSIDFLEKYYNADSDNELVGGSVSATEHSVMSMGSKENEIDTFRRLITEVYPKGILSIVSDTWDFWNVIDNILPKLKKEIMVREGKIVIRPDSGDPVKIICGNSVDKGAIERLWDTFGGKVNEKGFKELDSHIGLIYGDSITPERQQDILYYLSKKKFASTNVVLGIGSYTYQYVTRDTYGFVMKATWGQVNGKGQDIFKDPATGGWKKSHRGLLAVVEDVNGELVCLQRCSKETEEMGLLKTVFEDGKLIRVQSLADIRKRVESYL